MGRAMEFFSSAYRPGMILLLSTVFNSYVAAVIGTGAEAAAATAAVLSSAAVSLATFSSKFFKSASGASSVVVAAPVVSSEVSDENSGQNVREKGLGAMKAFVWDAATATVRTTAENFIVLVCIVEISWVL